MIEGVREEIYSLLNQGMMNQGQNLSLYFTRLCKDIDDPGSKKHEAKESAIKLLVSGLSDEAFNLYSRAFKN